MTLTTEQFLKFGSIVVIALAVVVATGIFASSLVHASAPTGLKATVATSSTPTVGTSPLLLFATSTCAARVITTSGISGVYLTFSDNQGKLPAQGSGIYQATSTTVTYDGGLFGCDAVRVASNATQVLTVMESR